MNEPLERAHSDYALRPTRIDDDLLDMKKEIVESRGLIIKTNNLATSLAADIKTIAKRQAGYERRFHWNSVTAYALFATLSFVGLKLASDARIAEIEHEKKQLGAQLSALRSEIGQENKRDAKRAKAEAAAHEFYESVRQRDDEKVIEQAARLRTLPLSRMEHELVLDEVTQAKRRLSVATLRQGMALSTSRKYAEATRRYREALRLDSDAPHAAQAKFLLAQALSAMGKHDQAIIYLRQIAADPKASSMHASAFWEIAKGAEKLGNLDEAQDTLKRLVGSFPRSEHTPLARKKLRALRKRIRRSAASDEV